MEMSGAVFSNTLLALLHPAVFVAFEAGLRILFELTWSGLSAAITFVWGDTCWELFTITSFTRFLGQPAYGGDTSSHSLPFFSSLITRAF